jgi:hypothetical protein
MTPQKEQCEKDTDGSSPRHLKSYPFNERQELRERNLLGLKKPFELDELLQSIEKILASPSKG